MNPAVLLGGIALLLAGTGLAVARVVAFANAVAEGTRPDAPRGEAAAVWHRAVRTHLPGVLAGAGVAAAGAAVLGWFTR